MNEFFVDLHEEVTSLNHLLHHAVEFAVLGVGDRALLQIVHLELLLRIVNFRVIQRGQVRDGVHKLVVEQHVVSHDFSHTFEKSNHFLH